MSDIVIPEYTSECPDGMLEQEFVVSENQVTADGEMKISDIAREMEKATEAHLSQYGMSRESLRAENKIWVISWNSLQIRRLPHLGETIKLRIWPGKNRSVMYTRKYAFYTAQGEPLVTDASVFILMDSVKRTAAMPTEKIKAIPVVTLEGEAKPPKMSLPFPKDYVHSASRIVQQGEIDKNGHLNNTCYLDWVMEFLTEEEQKKYCPKDVWVQYLKELKEGDEALLEYQWDGAELFVKGSSNGAESFFMRMIFE